MSNWTYKRIKLNFDTLPFNTNPTAQKGGSKEERGGEESSKGAKSWISSQDDPEGGAKQES